MEHFLATGAAGKQQFEMSRLSDDLEDKLGATGPAAPDRAFVLEEVSYAKDKVTRLQTEVTGKTAARNDAKARLDKATAEVKSSTAKARHAYAKMVQGMRWREGNLTAEVAAKEEVYLKYKMEAFKDQSSKAKAIRLLSDVQAGANDEEAPDANTSSEPSKAERNIEVVRRAVNLATAKHEMSIKLEDDARKALDGLKVRLRDTQAEVKKGVAAAARTLKDKILQSQRRLIPLTETLTRAKEDLEQATKRLTYAKEQLARAEAILQSVTKEEDKVPELATMGTGPGAAANVAKKFYYLGQLRGKQTADAVAVQAEKKLENRKKLTMYAQKIVRDEDLKSVKDSSALITALKELQRRRDEEAAATKKLRATISAAKDAAEAVSKDVTRGKQLKATVMATEKSLAVLASKIQQEELIGRAQVDAFSKSESAKLKVLGDRVDGAEKDTAKLEKQAAADNLKANDKQTEVVAASRKISSEISLESTKDAGEAVAERQRLITEEDKARKTAEDLEVASKKAAKLVVVLNSRLMDETQASKERITDLKNKLMGKVSEKMDKLRKANDDVAAKKVQQVQLAKGLADKMAELTRKRKQALVARHNLEDASNRAETASR